MTRPAGFLIDVPVTLSVAVRGDGLTLKEAKRIAREFADTLNPDDNYVSGYSVTAQADGVFAEGIEITEATLESSREESCELLEELEAEDEGI